MPPYPCCPSSSTLLTTPPPAPQINFVQDTIVSQENEYEILQLMMGDLRDRWGQGTLGCPCLAWCQVAWSGVLPDPMMSLLDVS